MIKLRPVIAILLVAVVLVLCTRELENDHVEVSGRELLVDGEPWFIKGICYHPVPKGSNSRSFENLQNDLELMQEAGINTIRVYSPVDDKQVLDMIDKAGMKLIVGFGYNQNGHYDILSGSFVDYIKKYQSHPSILLWELGNEYNYHPGWFDGDMKNWYTALNAAAAQIHKLDREHPAATAHGELPDSLALAMCPNVDVWGMNVYRWDDPEGIFTQWEAISEKPMYLSEAGADSYMAATMNGYEMGLNEKAQADATRSILDKVFKNADICSGVALFAFSDEWWKAGNINTQDPGGWAPESGGVPYDGAANEEYWGIVDIDRDKKMAFDVVREFYLNQH